MRSIRCRICVMILAALSLFAVSAVPASAAGTGGGCPGCITVKYYVDDIYGHYNGTYDYSTAHGCIGPCTATWSESMSYSNNWGASISFTKGPIEAKVTFDVDFSSSKSFSAAFPVPSGKTGVIRYKDWYHVTQMHIHKVTCGKTCSTTYGTGWAGQWYQRIFYLSVS